MGGRGRLDRGESAAYLVYVIGPWPRIPPGVFSIIPGGAAPLDQASPAPLLDFTTRLSTSLCIASDSFLPPSGTFLYPCRNLLRGGGKSSSRDGASCFSHDFSCMSIVPPTKCDLVSMLA